MATIMGHSRRIAEISLSDGVIPIHRICVEITSSYNEPWIQDRKGRPEFETIIPSKISMRGSSELWHDESL